MNKPLARHLLAWLALAGAVGAVWLTGARSAAGKPHATPAPLAIAAPAATPSPSPVPQEKALRGVWVPYMSLARGGDFQSNFRSIAESAKEKGFTALFVHVRAFCDALYPSQLYPWSHLLTGIQGQDPGFDPLDFMVDCAHGLGLEFHAWINPLRVSTGETPAALAADNPYSSLKDEYPYYFMEAGGGVYLNPGYPYIRTLVAKGAAEVAENYPVDGIHFDDYFYPDQDPALDLETYQLYAQSVARPLSQSDWRTANIDAMVAEVYQRVKAANPEAEFGISPQGNLENDRKMGADVAAWCASPGYIDYICPQLYYSYENDVLPYDQALADWSGLYRRKGLKLYAGLALYKTGSAEEPGWDGGDVLGRQVEAAAAAGWEGVVLYSIDYLEAGGAEEELENAAAAMAKMDGGFEK